MSTRLSLGILAAGLILSLGAGWLVWQDATAEALSGGAADARVSQVRGQIIDQTLLIAAMSLAAVLLVRRWVAQPLAEVVELVDVGARHEPFFDLARQQDDEFGRLSRAMGELVRRLDMAPVAAASQTPITSSSSPTPNPTPDAGASKPVRVAAPDPISQQKHQIRVLRTIGPALAEARNIDALLERTVAGMFDLLGVNAVGMAVRDGAMGRRTRQVLHRGSSAHLLESNRALVRHVETELLPDALAQPELLHWPDLDVARTGWSRAFSAAGLTSLAAVGVRASHDAQGVLWIARRGGDRVPPLALHLLEILAPLVAARLELAQVRERLQGLRLSDPVTDLPSQVQFEQALRHMVGRPGQPCAVLVIDLDRFEEHAQRLGQVGGALLLRAVATRLLAGCRRSSFLARLAGSSLGLIVPGLEGEAAAGLGRRLADTIAGEPFDSPDADPTHVTASIGVACFPADGLRPDELLDLALIRVDAARRAGRNRAVADSLDPSRRVG